MPRTAKDWSTSYYREHNIPLFLRRCITPSASLLFATVYRVLPEVIVQCRSMWTGAFGAAFTCLVVRERQGRVELRDIAVRVCTEVVEEEAAPPNV